MDNFTKKLYEAVDEQPDLLLELLAAEPVTRAGGAQTFTVLGQNIPQEQMAQIRRSLADSPIVKLILASAGSLDIVDLLKFVGGLTGNKKAEGNNNKAVKALFDGKLDLKDIMMIIVLLKLFKKKNTSAQQNTGLGLLGSLLGMNTTTNSGLLTANQQQPSSFINSLFGTNNTSTGLFGTQTTSPYTILFGTQPQNNNTLSSLLNFVNGNYNNNSQYSQLYNLFNTASNSAFSNSGTINSSVLFSLLNQLLR